MDSLGAILQYSGGVVAKGTRVFITRLKLQNWRNFKEIEVELRDRVFVIGPNASGKSNLLDVFRFLRDIAKPTGGGLQRAVEARGGVTQRC